jgi:hypothetical protein
MLHVSAPEQSLVFALLLMITPEQPSGGLACRCTTGAAAIMPQCPPPGLRCAPAPPAAAQTAAGSGSWHAPAPLSRLGPPSAARVEVRQVSRCGRQAGMAAASRQAYPAYPASIPRKAPHADGKRNCPHASVLPPTHLQARGAAALSQQLHERCLVAVVGLLPEGGRLISLPLQARQPGRQQVADVRTRGAAQLQLHRASKQLWQKSTVAQAGQPASQPAAPSHLPASQHENTQPARPPTCASASASRSCPCRASTSSCIAAARRCLASSSI